MNEEKRKLMESNIDEQIKVLESYINDKKNIRRNNEYSNMSFVKKEGDK